MRKYGKPPFTVVVVHGGPGAGGEMAPVARELSKSFGVLEPIQTKLSIEGQLNELKIILEKNSDFPVALIGFSWGAWLCYIFAAHYPVLVKKLIFIGSGPFEEKYAKKIQKTRFSRLSKKEIAEVESIFDILNNPTATNKNSVFKRFGKLFSKADTYDPLTIKSDTSEINFRLDIFHKVWPEAAELRKSGNLLKFGEKIKCPVVALHGDFDPHPAEGVRIPLSTTLNNFRFILLKNCGHKPWIEKQAKDNFYTHLKNELHK
jgi:pimeloyl-ACP methyl ester carboxylesterase